MNDSIQIEGTEYVSAKRASKETGYTRDYIGQLARGGQITARRVEGLWYVSLDSLKSHSTKAEEYKSEPPVPSQNLDLETSIIFDGREFLSASRAAKVSGYHQDYVTQLARTGKIPSRQMGSRWFVDRDALLAHKHQKDAMLALVQVEAVGLPQSPERSITHLKAPASATHIAPGDTNSRESNDSSSFFTYAPDSKSDLLPNVSQQEPAPTTHRIRTVPQQNSQITLGYHRPATDLQHRAAAPLKTASPIKSVSKHKSSFRLLHVAPIALTVVVVLTLGFTSLREKAVYAVSHVTSGGQTAAVFESTSSLARLAEWIESIFTRDLVYQSTK